MLNSVIYIDERDGERGKEVVVVELVIYILWVGYAITFSYLDGKILYTHMYAYFMRDIYNFLSFDDLHVYWCDVKMPPAQNIIVFNLNK